MLSRIITILTIAFMLVASPAGLGSLQSISTDTTVSVPVVHAQDDTTPGGPPPQAQRGAGSSEGGKTSNLDCGWIDPSCWLAWGGQAFMSIMSAFLYIAGILFEATLQKTVIDMATTIGFAEGASTGASDGIYATWTVLRDIANIFFIGVLVYLGISTILQVNQKDWEKLLVRVIVAALLVNFSLFFTQIIIDGANLAATEAYEMTDDLSGSTCSNIGEEDYSITNGGITCEFMDRLQLTNLFAGGNEGAFAGSSGNDRHFEIITVSLLGGIFILITAFIFAAAAILLISRFAVLLFLMVVSPIAFTAWVLPKTENISYSWWKALFKNALFAPAFILFVWVTLKIMDSITEAIGTDTSDTFAKALTQPSNDPSGIFINFAIVTGLLIASLIMAQKLGIKGSDAVVKVGNDLRKYGQSAIGANTIGRLGTGAQNLYNRAQGTIDNLGEDENDGGAKKLAGRTLRGLRTSAKVASGGILSDRNINSALDQAGRSQKFGGPESLKDIKAAEGKRGQERATRHKQDVQESALGELRNGKAFSELSEKHQKAVRGMSAKDIKEHKERDDTLDVPGLRGRKKLDKQNVLANLSPKQAEAVEKSDTFNDAEKGEFKQQRTAALKQKIDNGEAREVVEQMTPSQTSGLAPELLKQEDFAGQMTDQQYKKVMDSDDIRQDDKNQIEEARAAWLERKVREEPSYVTDTLLQKSPDEVAKLPENVLEMPQVAEHLNRSMLDKIASKNISERARNNIKRRLQNTITNERQSGNISPRLQGVEDWLYNTTNGKFF